MARKRFPMDVNSRPRWQTTGVRIWWVSAKVVHFLWRMPADSSGEDTMSVKRLVVVAHLFQVPCRPTLTRSLLAISILRRANPLVAYGMAVLARGGLP